MNDQQQSRADALTDASALALYEKASIAASEFDSVEAAHVAFVRSILSSFHVEQPAAAPIDTPTDREFALSAAICVHPKGVYGDEGGSMRCPITHTRDASFAPALADERAAFEKVFPMPADCQRIGSGLTAGYAPTEYGAREAHDFIRRWEGWKARAAASPAAEAVRLTDEQRRVLVEVAQTFKGTDRRRAVLNELAGVAAPQPAQASPPAEAVQEQIIAAAMDCIRHDASPDWQRAALKNRLRAIFAAPQPAQADAPVRTEALRKGLFEARDAMRVMSNWVKEIDPAGYSWGIHMVHRANAVLNGGADTAQADAPAEAREPHSDDVAVDSFAAAMKHKLALARAKGRGGWETCSPADLSRMLREHVEKGDPRDVANFCMMLWHHGSPIVSAPADSGEARLTDEQIETLAHRRAYRYRHGPDSIEFIFNRHCLLNFARALLQGANHAE